MENTIVRNENIVPQRILAIMLCFTIIFIPLSISMLLSARKPTDFIKGRVTNKRSEVKSFSNGFGSTVGTWYYVTVEATEFMATAGIYKKLEIGKYVKAAYRKKWLHYIEIL